MFEITPVLDNEGKIPLYIQLSDYFKQQISSGKMTMGEKLPSKRKMSNYLEVSINTVQAAYDQLCAEGYVESKPRKGVYVCSIGEEINSSQTNHFSEKSKIKKYSSYKIDFNSGKVDINHFPYSIWRKITVESLYADQGELFYNGEPQGEQCLRQEIASYLFQSRGVNCKPEQIVIGAGTQVLTGLLCVLIGKEKTYALEHPGFHRTRTVLRDYGVTTCSIPLDENGLSVEKLRASDASVVYVTPSHQFPCGMIMPISRRLELLKWAEECDGYIIEDDYDGEYRYKGKPIPSLQGLDTNGKVVYLGMFSKSLIPSIRISYLVLPPELATKYQEHFTVYKQTASRLHQITLFHFMNKGYWQRHLNKMRTLYRKKQNSLLLAINKYLQDQVQIIGEKSGLHLIIDVQNGMSEEELIKSAREIGVKVYPTSIYYEGTEEIPESQILLGFGGLLETELEEGIRLLKECWRIYDT